MPRNPAPRSTDLTMADIDADVEADIAKAREAQRGLQASGQHFAADLKGQEIDGYLDELYRY